MKRVLVRGPALSTSGYGEQCRFALRALLAHEERFEVFLQNINWGRTGWIAMDDKERVMIDQMMGKTSIFLQQGGKFDISLQVTIPNEWDNSLAPYNIGYTAGIESTKIAPQWIEPSNRMDKIIVVSNHAKQGFDNTSYSAKNDMNEIREFKVETPIEVVNYPVRDIEPETLDLELSSDFNFLSVCQWGPRKNLEATIFSFIEEFLNEDVGLVLKTNIMKNNVTDKAACHQRLEGFLKNFPNRKCKIYLVHGNLTSSEMAGLYTHPKIKALVSTTHGEGFGLPLFEAAYSGLPIIAPNWSGHVDFLYAPTKDKKTGKFKNRPHFLKLEYGLKQIQPSAVWEGVLQADSKWCFVKNTNVKKVMREAFNNIEIRELVARKLKKHVLEKFNKEDIYMQFADAVHESDNAWENDLDAISEI